jgi:hypothetical protein
MGRGILTLAAAALLACRTTPEAGGAPAGDTCFVAGGPQAPVQVSVYESSPWGAPAGRRLFIGLLNRGQRERVDSADGQLWYSYRWHEGDTWRDAGDFTCSGGATVELPLAR